jgi:hypothetical protein
MRVVSVRIPALFALTALAVTVAGPAFAHQSTGPGEAGDVPAKVQRALGGEVEALDNGLYRIEVPHGPDVKTHGPDLRAGIDAVANHGSGLGPGDPERPPVCVADASTGYYQEVLYGYPAYATDDVATHRASIQAAFRRMNAVLDEESLASGGPDADYIVRCESDESIRVSSFVVPIAGGDASFSQVRTAARVAGYTNPKADYTIFYDGTGPSGVCGTASFYSDDSPGAGNLNNNSGASAGYAVTYRSCWLGATPMHENGHNQGAVQYSAPYSTGSGAHCYDENDVMCYSPDGGDLNQSGTISRCADFLHFDCGNDTYFDSAPEPGEWLASHWNIGSGVNRFVSFGPDDGNDPPSASFESSCLALACSLTDTSADDDGAVVSRSWSFGDGSSATGAGVAHSYAAAGSYPVTLTVTDDDGASASAVRSLSVAAPQPDVTPGGPSGSDGGGEGPPGAGAKPPDTAIASGPPARTRRHQVSFELVSDPPGASFECRFDSGEFAPCREAFSVSTGRGSHRLVARARDAAGGADPLPARHFWRVVGRR